MTTLDPESTRRALSRFIREELLQRPDFPLKPDSHLITGGYLDSFSLARLGVFIEEAFGVFIPDSELTVDRMDTLDQMLDQIARWKRP